MSVDCDPGPVNGKEEGAVKSTQGTKVESSNSG